MVENQFYTNVFPGRQATDLVTLPFNSILSQGTRAVEVIGNKVMLKYLHVQGQIQLINNRFIPPVGVQPPTWNSTADNLINVFQPVKFWVGIIKNLEALGDVSSMVNRMWNANDQNYINMTSFKAWDYQKEIQIIYQKTWMLSTIKNPQVLVRLKIPIKRITSWNVTDPQDARQNVLIMGLISDTATTYSQARCDLLTRVTFTDA